jgi:PAS domain S-box-containing protein
MTDAATLLDATAAGIVIADTHGRCTAVNRTASEILGRSGDALRGVSIGTLVQDASPKRFLTEAASAGQSVVFREAHFIRGDGSSVPVEYSVARIENGILVTFQEAHLEPSLRVATVAHEFNNVLMGIQASADLLRRETISSEVRIKAVDHIQNALLRGKRITDEILRFTQPKEPVLSEIEVETLLKNFVAVAQSAVGERCRIDLEVQDRLFIYVDPAQVDQCLTNLVFNARDAMNGDGRIAIVARQEPSDAGFVHISVSDTGAGMQPEIVDRVFEPFFTTKQVGTGLGLWIVHQIVTRHHGRISVKSKVGAGTTFHLHLPTP